MGNVEKRRPTREEYAKLIDTVRIPYYKYMHKFNRGEYEPRWRGVRVVKPPTDLILYAEAIFDKRPDFIVETGTRFGGSTLFFGDMLLLAGGKKVFSIDIKPHRPLKKHPFVEYLRGSSTDPDMYKQIKKRVKNKGKVMVVLDSEHTTEHVTKELDLYSRIVTPGQYLVVEDSWSQKENPEGPYYAVKDFLEKHQEFERHYPEKKYIFAHTRDGWLLKKGDV